MHLPPCRPALLPPGRRSALLPPCRPALLPAPQLCYCQPRTRSPTPELLHAPHPQPHTRATACPSPPHPSPPPLPPGDPHRGQHQPSLIPCWPVPDGLTPTGGCLGGGAATWEGGGAATSAVPLVCVCVCRWWRRWCSVASTRSSHPPAKTCCQTLSQASSCYSHTALLTLPSGELQGQGWGLG